jgi:hypothetical protein
MLRDLFCLRIGEVLAADALRGRERCGVGSGRKRALRMHHAADIHREPNDHDDDKNAEREDHGNRAAFVADEVTLEILGCFQRTGEHLQLSIDRPGRPALGPAS